MPTPVGGSLTCTCTSQVPVVDADELSQFVHHQWTDVSNMENSENDPQVEVQPPSIDFGSIGFVASPFTRVIFFPLIDQEHLGTIDSPARYYG